jgi:hypothetical protein
MAPPESDMVKTLRAIAARSRDVVVSPALSLWERNKLAEFGETAPRHQPVFMIGAPRTGSTILYQALTNYFDLLYIDNLACKWRKNLFFGFWLSSKRFGRKPHDNFSAHHGSTADFGGHAPSECGGFWYRWLPTDRHFISEEDITPAMVREIRRELTAVTNYFDRPLIIKNLNAGQRLRLIRACFPEARIIYIRRDRRFVVESIMRARRATAAKANELWSIKPRDFHKLLGLPELEMVAAQVCAIERQIDGDLQLFPEENVRTVYFDDFSPALVHDLGSFINASPRASGSLPSFRTDAVGSIPLDRMEQLEDALLKHDGAESSVKDRN